MIIRSIGELLKDQVLVSVQPETRVDVACRLFEVHNIGAMPVILGHRLVGILSERDVIRRCLAQAKTPSDLMVNDIMTPDPEVILVNESLSRAMQTMCEGGFRHLPVMDRNGTTIGVVSMRDIPTEYRLMVERFGEYRAPVAAE